LTFAGVRAKTSTLMSRGLGKAQRLVLDALRAHQRGADIYHRYLSAYEIAHFGACDGKLEEGGGIWARGGLQRRCKKCGGPHEISLAEAESVRRAIRTLAKAGLVASIRYPVLRTRLPLPAQEKEREDKESVMIQRHAAAVVEWANR
jgi:hypothetical protein